MSIHRLLALRLLLLALSFAALLAVAAPARPVSAAPSCSSIADQPFVSGSLVRARHTVRCTAVLASITVHGRLAWNGTVMAGQSATCQTASFCYVYTEYPKISGAWRAFTAGGTTGPTVAVPSSQSAILNVP